MARAAGGLRIPHAFPFRLVEGEWRETPADAEGRELVRSVRVRLTQGAAVARGRADYPPILTLEILAQAALVLAGAHGAAEEADEGGVRLAGFDSVRFADELARRPLRAGDELEVRVRTVARFGALRKAEGALMREGAEVLRADMLLAGSP